jgi:hypothetical protein
VLLLALCLGLQCNSLHTEITTIVCSHLCPTPHRRFIKRLLQSL